MPAGKVAVFGPHPMLSITIEALTSDGGDDIHLHAAGGLGGKPDLVKINDGSPRRAGIG